MKIFLIISVLFLAALVVAEKKSFTGYKLLHVRISDKELLEKINSYEHVDPEFDVWGVKLENGKYVITIMLSPKVINKYLRILRSLRVDVEIANDNVQDIFDEEDRTMRLFNLKKNSRGIVNSYVKSPEIINFIKDTVDNNTDITTTYVAGYSTEGRELRVIKFATGTRNRGIWIDCGIHAREWVTPAACVYIIDQIVKEYRARNPETVALLNKYEIHILALYNPDGYDYSHADNRLWRKNRAKNGGLITLCHGVDLNRNADFRWNTGGASDLTCSDTYAGTKGNSEPETKAVTDTLKAKPAGFWEAYFSLHTYGNWWLLPWGHDPNDVAPNFAELKENGEVGAAAIKALYGEVFTVGSSSALLYVTTGSTADWAYGVLNISFSATLELRAGSTTDGNSGFVLPVDKLPQATSETWAGLKAAFVDISAKRP